MALALVVHRFHKLVDHVMAALQGAEQDDDRHRGFRYVRPGPEGYNDDGTFVTRFRANMNWTRLIFVRRAGTMQLYTMILAAKAYASTYRKPLGVSPSSTFHLTRMRAPR